MVSLPPPMEAHRRIFGRVICSEAAQPQEMLDEMSRRICRHCRHANEGEELVCECTAQENVWDLDPLYFSMAGSDGEPWIDVFFSDILLLTPFFENGAKLFNFNGLAVKSNFRADAIRQIRMMELAGDCSVRVLGRYFGFTGHIEGMVMPMEKDVDLNVPEIEKWTVARELLDLVHRLHALDIIHGDLKPGNILRCSDGKLRLIDFDLASFEGEDFVMPLCTAEYTSPRRIDDLYQPLSKADDLHGLGVTLWELFAGMFPWSYTDKDPIEYLSLVESGMYLNLSYVKDARARTVIQKCFDGNMPSEETLCNQIDVTQLDPINMDADQCDSSVDDLAGSAMDVRP